MKELLLNRSKQSDGFHFTGNITVGSRTEDMTNGQYVYFYGFLRDYNSNTSNAMWSPGANFGQVQGLEIINGLYSDKNNVNASVSTQLTIMDNVDMTKYENKTFTITRLDTGQVVSTRYVYTEVEGAPEKSGWGWEQINSMLFTSADVGKTITVQLEIN